MDYAGVLVGILGIIIGQTLQAAHYHIQDRKQNQLIQRQNELLELIEEHTSHIPKA